MKNLVYFVLIIGLLIVSPLSAETKAETNAMTVNTTELRGFVFDERTNESLAGVLVSVNGQKVYTDFEGQFKVKNLCIGKCELRVSFISYQERMLTVDTSKETLLKVALRQR